MSATEQEASSRIHVAPKQGRASLALMIQRWAECKGKCDQLARGHAVAVRLGIWSWQDAISIMRCAIHEASEASQMPFAVVPKNANEAAKREVLQIATLRKSSSSQEELMVLLCHGGGFESGTALLVEEWVVV